MLHQQESTPAPARGDLMHYDRTTILLHWLTAAALAHQPLLKDGVLARMLPGMASQ